MQVTLMKGGEIRKADSAQRFITVKGKKVPIGAGGKTSGGASASEDSKANRKWTRKFNQFLAMLAPDMVVRHQEVAVLRDKGLNPHDAVQAIMQRRR